MMKKLLAGLFFLSGTAWATYIPVNGSTVNVQNVIGQVATVVVDTPPVSINGTVTTSVSGAVTVTQGTTTVNGSTVAVVNAAGTTLAISGNLTGNQNVTVNTALPAGANNIGGVVVIDTPPVSAQQSGVWSSVVVDTPPVNVTGDTVTAMGSLSNNGAAATANRIGNLPGISQTDYNNGTASTQGRDVSQNIGTDGLLWTANLPAIRPASYQASTGAIAAAASATDIAEICGNPNDTVLVTGLRVSCTQTTAGVIELAMIKRSAADTGAFSTMTATAQDNNYAIAGSSATYFTANPTVGASVGNLDVQRIGCMATSTASPNDMYVANWRMKPIVLNASSQCVAVNLEGATVTGGNFTVSWDWIETKTITP